MRIVLRTNLDRYRGILPKDMEVVPYQGTYVEMPKEVHDDLRRRVLPYRLEVKSITYRMVNVSEATWNPRFGTEVEVDLHFSADDIASFGAVGNVPLSER